MSGLPAVLAAVVVAAAAASPAPAPPVAAPTSVPARPAVELATLVEDATAAFPTVVAAREELAAAEAGLVAARGAFDPAWRTRAGATPQGAYPNSRVDTALEQATPWWGAIFSGGWRLGQGAFAPYDGKAATLDGGELRLGVAVPLWRNGPIDRRRAELARAEAGVEAARAGLAAARLEAGRAIADRYWSWASAGWRRAIAERMLAIALRREADLAAAVKAGQLAAVERVENQRAIAQRRGNLVQAERAVEQAAIELDVYRRAQGASVPALGDPPSAPPAAPARPTPAATAEAEAEARRLRPELRRLAALIRQAETDQALAANDLAPGLDFSVGTSRDLGAGDPRLATPELETGLALDVPLVARGPRGRLAQADAALRRLGALRQLAGERVAADVRDAASAISAARRRIEAAAGEVAVAWRLVAAERARLTLGEGSMFLVNQREQAAAEAEAREADAQADLRRAVVAFAVARGALPDGSEP